MNETTVKYLKICLRAIGQMEGRPSSAMIEASIKACEWRGKQPKGNDGNKTKK